MTEVEISLREQALRDSEARAVLSDLIEEQGSCLLVMAPDDGESLEIHYECEYGCGESGTIDGDGTNMEAMSGNGFGNGFSGLHGGGFGTGHSPYLFVDK